LAVAKKIVLFQEGRMKNYADLKLKKIVDVEKDAVPIYELEDPLVRMMANLLNDDSMNSDPNWKDKTYQSIMQASTIEGVQKRFESLLKEDLGNISELSGGVGKLSADQLKLSRGFRNELLEITLKQCLESCDENMKRKYFYEGSPTRKLIERKMEGKPFYSDASEYSLVKPRDLAFSNNVFKVLKEHKFQANVPIVMVVGNNHKNGVADHLKQFGFNPQVWNVNLVFGDKNSALKFLSHTAMIFGASKCLENQEEFDCFLDSVDQRGPILDWTEFKQPSNFKESNFNESNYLGKPTVTAF
jgi:hypothetical protein